MDYTLSNSYDTDAGTGNRMHEDSKAVPTAVTDLDMNSIMWSLMEVLKAADLPGIQFDKANPASYQQLLKAIRSLSVSTTVPATFRGYEILVTEPHSRKMVWNGTTYVRAPWHQPGMVLYSYDNPSSIPGYLPIRADVSYNQANYPDLVARLGLSGAGTFALVELRGEFIRCLDNGRGVNAGRALRSAEAGDNRAHSHVLSDGGHTHYVNDPSHVHPAWTDTRGNHNHGGVKVPPNVLDNDRGANGAQSYYSLDNDGTLPWDGNHEHAVGVGGALTGIYLSASATGIGMGIDGSEARPRNVAFPAWISY